MEWVTVEIPKLAVDFSGPESLKIKARFSHILKRFGYDLDTGKVLDVGSGPGNYQITPNAFCVDNNAAYLDLDNPRHFVADATNMPFADGEFRIVVNSHNFEHIEQDRSAMLEMWRVLAHEGFLLLYLPHRALFMPAAEHSSHVRDVDPRYIIDVMDKVGCRYKLLDCSILNGWREFSFSMIFRRLP